MRLSVSLAVLAAVAVPLPAAAQVAGAIVIGGFPVAGIVTIGVPVRPVRVRMRSPAVVVIERCRPSHVVVLERRVHGRGHHGSVRILHAEGRYLPEPTRYSRSVRPGLVEVGLAER